MTSRYKKKKKIEYSTDKVVSSNYCLISNFSHLLLSSVVFKEEQRAYLESYTHFTQQQKIAVIVLTNSRARPF